MTEYDLTRDWTLHGCVDEDGAKKVLSRLRLEEGWKDFLEGDTRLDELRETISELETANEDLEMEVNNLTDKIERLEENSDA